MMDLNQQFQIVSDQSIIDMLVSHELFESIDVFAEGKKITDLAVLSRIYVGLIGYKNINNVLEGKYTLRINQVELRNHFFAAQFKELEKKFSAPVTGNIYISPGQCASGLLWHADPTDVIIYQISGEKEWSLACDKNGNFIKDDRGDFFKNILSNRSPNFEFKKINLAKSQTLFVPRAVPHMVNNRSLNASYHLTVAIMRPAVKDYIQFVYDKIIMEMPVNAAFSAEQNLNNKIINILASKENTQEEFKEYFKKQFSL